MVLGPMDKYITCGTKRSSVTPLTRHQLHETHLNQTNLMQYAQQRDHHLRENKRIYHRSKTEHTIRIYSQNINGLCMDNSSKLQTIHNNVISLEVDISCFQEVNDSLPRHNRCKITKALTSGNKPAGLAISTLHPFHTRTTYQPGGTMVAVSNYQHLRIKSEAEPQKMGRWAVITLSFPSSDITGSGRIHIYSIYRATAELSGDNSSLSQQMKSLAKADRDISPLPAFEKDLLEQLTRLHAKGDKLILTGDFNSTTKHETIQKIRQTLSLTDIMSKWHEHTPPTREHGTKTIDHILMSTSLIPAVTNAEYLPFKYGVFSDHRALVIDISTTILKAKPEILNKKRSKKLDSRVCPNAKIYKNNMTTFLRSSGQVKRLREIRTPRNKKERRRAVRGLELFDRKQTNEMIQAENKLPQRYGHLWSPQLRDSAKLLHYWKTRLKEKLNNSVLHPDVSQKLEEDIATLDTNQEQPEWNTRKQHKVAIQEMRITT